MNWDRKTPGVTPYSYECQLREVRLVERSVERASKEVERRERMESAIRMTFYHDGLVTHQEHSRREVAEALGEVRFEMARKRSFRGWLEAVTSWILNRR